MKKHSSGAAEHVFRCAKECTKYGNHKAGAALHQTWIHPWRRSRYCTSSFSINRPKDVQGCPAAPEEFSFTAFLALFLFVVLIVCESVCGWVGAPRTDCKLNRLAHVGSVFLLRLTPQVHRVLKTVLMAYDHEHEVLHGGFLGLLVSAEPKRGAGEGTGGILYHLNPRSLFEHPNRFRTTFEELCFNPLSCPLWFRNGLKATWSFQRSKRVTGGDSPKNTACVRGNHTLAHTRMTQSDQSPEPARTGQAQALVVSRFSSGRKQSKKRHDHQRLGAFLQYRVRGGGTSCTRS